MADPEATGQGESGGPRCDFCGREVDRVRRVALDGDYERLRKPHREQYACPECSEAKEKSRRGLERG